LKNIKNLISSILHFLMFLFLYASGIVAGSMGSTASAISLCRQMYCMGKFQMIFLYMEYENSNLKSLVLFNANFAVRSMRLPVAKFTQLFNPQCHCYIG